METLKLFMLLLGCKPANRNTEQHDVFFGIGYDLKDLLQDIEAFWPEGQKNLHLDGWREVTKVDNYTVRVEPRETLSEDQRVRLFFLNLGGYKPGEFEEYHYKLLAACTDKGTAVQQARQTAFFRHTGFKGARSHIDEKYGVDVDDVYEISDILPPAMKEKYRIVVSVADGGKEDELQLGYVQLWKLRDD